MQKYPQGGTTTNSASADASVHNDPNTYMREAPPSYSECAYPVNPSINTSNPNPWQNQAGNQFYSSAGFQPPYPPPPVVHIYPPNSRTYHPQTGGQSGNFSGPPQFVGANITANVHNLCQHCRIGTVEESFDNVLLIIIVIGAICLFPFGLLCLLFFPYVFKKKCTFCGK
ncbi:hypothetical protein AB6A40_001713 [Gnathostoma spinigerum]|uniref:Membrane protein BRI3 n=1 Tax=Gnathostoma spinigerum TaxID=75299 RepID=A0ABD6ECD7_9BILA